MQPWLFGLLPLAGFILGWTIRWLYAMFQLSSAEQRAERLRNDAVKNAKAKEKELVLETKDALIRERNEQEKELRNMRGSLQHFEQRLLQKEDNLEKKTAAVEKERQGFVTRERTIEAKEKSLRDKEIDWRNKIEGIAQLTQEDAREQILSSLKNEVQRSSQGIVHKIEQEALASAEKRAKEILVSTAQRMASEVTGDITIATVVLPNEEMKGRIIGREGRNIRTLETLTGADIIIDETVEAVTVSCFDSVRKEIAKRSLERLIRDGRIHPTRVEEIVKKVTSEMTKAIYEEGEQALYELNIHHLKPEGIRGLGRLAFRVSYGQNILTHSKEVAVLAGSLAAEMGADVDIAKRGGLLHDVGKGIEANGDSSHVELGVELAKSINEDDRVINAIAAHHGDVPHNCIESVIVQIADSISASRPGARRETLTSYIKRLENLETIASEFDGVEKAYAIQAGRELRVMVNHEKVSDQETKDIARSIAKSIEDQLQYPGRIKITMIRENRVVEYAR